MFFVVWVCVYTLLILWNHPTTQNFFGSSCRTDRHYKCQLRLHRFNRQQPNKPSAYAHYHPHYYHSNKLLNNYPRSSLCYMYHAMIIPSPCYIPSCSICWNSTCQIHSRTYSHVRHLWKRLFAKRMSFQKEFQYVTVQYSTVQYSCLYKSQQMKTQICYLTWEKRINMKTIHCR